MKHKTRQQRNLSFKQIVKRKNKKNKKTKNLSIKQTRKRKNKKTRKQQRGGLLGSIYTRIMNINSKQPLTKEERRLRLEREDMMYAAAMAAYAPVYAAEKRAAEKRAAERAEAAERVVETDNRGVIVMDRVMDRPVAQGIPVASTVRVPVNTAISSIRDSAQEDAAALVGVPVTSSDVEYNGPEYYFDHVLNLDGYSGEGSVADGIPVVDGVEPRQSAGIQVH